MRSKSWILCTLACLSLTATMAGADELKMVNQPQPSVEHPSRGMSMEKVEAKFGAPVNRIPAVGDPPITRWEYPGFIVYFEHNLVLHSVVKP
jgi:hypothetical protein